MVKKKLKVLLADDEPLSRDELKFLLSKYTQVEVIGEAENGEQALALVGQREPDVIFLDINMPGIDGLGVAKILHNFRKVPKIVFATAYDEHALAAFEVNALDYLLKPFSEERVGETIKRLCSSAEEPTPEEVKTEQTINSCKKIAVNLDGSVKLVCLQDAVYFYAEGKNVFLKTFSERFKTSQNMSELEEKLPSPPFFRCHKGYLVNLDYVEELHPWFNGAYQVVVKDEERSQLPVSRLLVKKLKEVIKL